MDEIISLDDLNKKITDFFILNHHKINKENSTFNLGEIWDLIKQYNGEDWKKYQEVNIEKYNRNTIFTDNENRFDIHIITWAPGQKSSIHGHAKNGCIMKILCGELKEVKYANVNKRNLSIRSRIHKKNDISYIDDKIGYHFIKNNGEEVVVSLHIYSPAKFKFNFDTFYS